MAELTRLTREDRETIREFRTRGILQDVEAHRLDQKEGVILVTCGDGDRFFDIFNYQVRMQAGHRVHPRIHLLSWNGGPLTLAENSPVNHIPGASDVFLKHVEDAHRLKTIHSVALKAHAPCGAAYGASLSFRRVVELLFSAKYRVKKCTPPGTTVACFLHVDYGDMLRRTYYIDHKGWFLYNEQFSPHLVCRASS